MLPLNALSPNEFYCLRDERTETLVAGTALQSAKLTLSIDEREAETLAGQLGFLLLVNLNARWCRHITLRVPDVVTHPGLSGIGTGNLPTLALTLARRADPFGTFDLCAQIEDTEATPAGVHVGSDGPARAYLIMGRGWMAEAGSHLRSTPIVGEEGNPLGAALAACIGTCHAMRQVLRLSPIFSDVTLSLWNMADGVDAVDGPPLERVTLGRVLLVGAGAIGAGIAYLLPLVRPSMESLTAIDEDSVDYPNLNRIPLFFAEDVGAKKVGIIRSYLEGWGIKTDAIGEWFDGSTLPLSQFDLLIPAANERGVREAIMSNIPPLMISGSTGTQWDAYQQRHIPLNDDCLSCRFPPVKQAARMSCSTGALTPSDPGAPKETGALPFLSIAGAVMAVSEITKLAYDCCPENGNYSTLWFSGEYLRFMTATKAKRSNCSYCIEPEIFRALRRGGLFASLSAR